MRFAAQVVCAILTTVVISGCFKHTYTHGAGAPNGAEVYSSWHSHWLFGIIGDENVDVKKYCPSGNATIHDEVSFLNGIIGLFIGIVYYPTTVTIKCDTGREVSFQIDRNTAARILADERFLPSVEEVAPELLSDALLARETAVTSADSNTLAKR